jgi:mannose-6-phosphate isomerase-like protein (cupin superfamily)
MTSTSKPMESLDGNAIAGALFEHFGQEMTTASGTCAYCGTRSHIGQLRVYSLAPGSVVRCRNCGQVVMVLVEIRGTTRLDRAAFERLDPDPPPHQVAELLHLGAHETLRILRETRDELEVEGTWSPGGSPPPPHLHPSQDEQFEIRSGRLTAVVDGREHTLGPGDRLTIPRRTPHKMWNSGEGVATALWLTRPAGRTAEWFRTIDRLGEHGTRRPSFPAMAKALQTHSDVFVLAVGPKLLRPLIALLIRAAARTQH